MPCAWSARPSKRGVSPMPSISPRNSGTISGSCRAATSSNRSNSSPDTCDSYSDPASSAFMPAQYLGDRAAELRGAGSDGQPVGHHDLGLLGSAVPARGYDRTRVTHATPLGCREPRHIADDGLAHVLLDPARSLGLLRTADLPDDHDRLGLRVLLEEHQVVQEGAAVDGIPADPDARGLADAERIHLGGGFIAERSRARDDA